MLIGGIALGLVLGLLGGRQPDQPRLHPAPPDGPAVRRGLHPVRDRDPAQRRVPAGELLRLPLLGGSFALLLAGALAEPHLPGHEPRLHRHPGQRRGHRRQRRLHADLGAGPPAGRPRGGPTSGRSTTSCRPPLDANFLLHLGPLADVIPIPLPIIQNVASIGDAFLTLGLAFFLFAAVVRVPQALEEELRAAAQARLAATGPRWPARPGDEGYETGLSPAWNASVALERPLVMGSAGANLASPSLARVRALDDRASRHRSRSRSRGHRPRRSSASASTRMSASRSTARSRRCGPASSSRSSATGSTSSRWSRSWPPRPARRSRPGWSSSRPRCRTCSSARSRARSSTAGTTRRSWSSATSSARRSSCSSRSPR